MLLGEKEIIEATGGQTYGGITYPDRDNRLLKAQLKKVVEEAQRQEVFPTEMEAIADGCRHCLDFWQVLLKETE